MQGLVLQDISKRFGKKQALRGVSCKVGCGITALLGPNGAGKTTLMNIICTLLKADTGKVTYNGQDIREQKTAYLEKLSVQFQNQPMYKSDTAIEYLDFCAALKGIPQKKAQEQGQALLEQFGITDTGKKRIAAFSGGMRQRLALCGTFLGNPELILLDEPSAGLDIYEREELKRYLCELKKDRLIIISTHIVSDIENIADNIILLSNGSIHASGTQQALIQAIQGKIWQVPDSAEVKEKTYHSDGKRLCYSTQKPCPEAINKQADLTDVYFTCANLR